jgi:hypothetical protein
LIVFCFSFFIFHFLLFDFAGFLGVSFKYWNYIEGDDLTLWLTVSNVSPWLSRSTGKGSKLCRFSLWHNIDSRWEKTKGEEEVKLVAGAD